MREGKMRHKLAISIICFVITTLLVGCKTKRTVVISLAGSSSTDIHTVVDECAREYGHILVFNENWLQDKGDGVAKNSDAERIRDEINTLTSSNGGDKSNLTLLVVGRSAGGVLAWNTFKRHYGDLDDFHRAALVMVDPHGSVKDDGDRGPYCDRQNLWWPGDWSSDKDIFRVYNIYQHQEGSAGANFPDSRVFKNIKISESGISHDSIPGHEGTRKLITEALDFVFSGS
jgi:pimeloyl-ACP methyl ester carboxylesterase